MDQNRTGQDCEKIFAELKTDQVEQVGGGLIMPLPINPLVNWIIRKLIY